MESDSSVSILRANIWQKLLSKKTTPILYALIFFAIGTAAILLTHASPSSYSLWSTSTIPTNANANDSASVELGVVFKSRYAGQITGVRFYKGTQNTGTHTGTLWDSKGNELAHVTFANETASGWQTATFQQPINIAANVNYVISYHAPKGHYSYNTSYFSTAHTNGPLTAPKNTSASGNGRYIYSGTTTFPTQVYKATNYWVDVIFSMAGQSVAPAPPSGVTATQSGSAINVTWQAAQSASGISKYLVFRNGSQITSVSGTTLSYNDSNVTAGQTYSYQIESEDSTNTTSALSVTATVTYNETPPQQSPTPPSEPTGNGAYNHPVTNGSQLTINDVGPWALQAVPKGSEQLQTVNPVGRLSLYSGWGRPSWIPGNSYVYNNDPSNHGGVVPAGGMTIDGYFVPGGTWVAQFDNFTSGVIIEGNGGQTSLGAWPGVVFRGDRMRGQWSAPGWFNQNAQQNNGIIWTMYCDAGGTTAKLPNITESIFESQGNGGANAPDKFYAIRNYLSLATTLMFLRDSGDAAIENYGEGTVPYYNDTTYHMNGIANNGGQTATLWLRNHLSFSPQPGDSPYNFPQNDVIQMAADGGAYPGTGTNLDGSTGYQIRDNYLGGANYTLQLGVDKNNTAADVRNVVVTGNEFTTQWFQNSGATGISYKNPTWGSYGNVWSNNSWSDDYGTGSWPNTRQYPSGNGPLTGQAVSAPTNQ